MQLKDHYQRPRFPSLPGHLTFFGVSGVILATLSLFIFVSALYSPAALDLTDLTEDRPVGTQGYTRCCGLIEAKPAEEMLVIFMGQDELGATLVHNI